MKIDHIVTATLEERFPAVIGQAAAKEMGIAYEFNGFVDTFRHYFKSLSKMGRPIFDRKATIITNPILRPVKRLEDNTLLFGIHDAEDGQHYQGKWVVWSKTCPDFHFTEAEMAKDRRFKKII